VGQASAGLRRALASLLVFLLYSPALAAGGEGKTSKAAFSWEKGLQLTAFEDKLTVSEPGQA